jgi:lipoprotein-releasing system permease protein
MALPYELTIALRYIRSRKKGPVSLITMITIGGVAVGVSALTVVTSVWNGFEAEFLEKLLGINAHAVILRNHDVFRKHEDFATKLRAQKGITFVAPFVYSEVIAQSARGVSGVAIKGVKPDLARQTPLSRFLPPEAFDRLHSEAPEPGLLPEPDETEDEPGMFIGKELQEALHVEMGDVVTIVSPYGGADGQPRTKAFEIVGIFHSGMYEFDSRMVFVDIREAQRFFRLYRTVTGLEVWSVDPMTSGEIIKGGVRAAEPNPLKYDVRDWKRTNRGLFGAVKSQKALITLVLGFINLVDPREVPRDRSAEVARG